MFYNTEDRFSGDIANVIFFAHFEKETVHATLVIGVRGCQVLMDEIVLCTYSRYNQTIQI